MNFKFAHNNFNVKDLDKSLKFYEEALGLKEVRRKEAEAGSLQRNELSHWNQLSLISSLQGTFPHINTIPKNTSSAKRQTATFVTPRPKRMPPLLAQNAEEGG